MEIQALGSQRHKKHILFSFLSLTRCVNQEKWQYLAGPPSSLLSNGHNKIYPKRFTRMKTGTMTPHKYEQPSWPQFTFGIASFSC